MNPKILKLREEISKNRAKISVLQSRNRDMERQLRELENLDIVGIVRAQGLTLEQFAEMFSHRSSLTFIPKEEEATNAEI